MEAVTGQLVRDVEDPDGLHCAECGQCRRYVWLPVALGPDQIAMCERCWLFADVRSHAWAWLNEPHRVPTVPMSSSVIGALPNDLLRALAWGTHSN